MNFLQICQRVASKAGISGSSPITTIGQTGEAARIINWVQDAYVDIQERKPNWWFLRKDFEFNCVSGASTYAKSTVANNANWINRDIRCYLNTINDEQWLCYREWEDFKATRLIGSTRAVVGRPQDYSIKPDKSIIFYPIPNDTYTIVGEHFQTARLFSGDDDVPLFGQYQMIIVYQALMYYAAYSSDASVYADAQKNFERLIDKLEYDETPKLQLNGIF